MKNRITQRGITSLLILFATLFALVAAILPVLVSADPAPAAEDGEIEDFYYQTLIGADVKDSAKTDLRFLFSVGSLAYDAVGFVFSKSNDPVKVDEPKKNYTTSATVYGTVTANDEPIDAPAGRHWAAIKLSDIPHASFATYVYVRPFVEDGEGTRYGETQRINVCEALGHAHEIKYPEGTATRLTPGTRRGDCEACGLYGIVEEDVHPVGHCGCDALAVDLYARAAHLAFAQQVEERSRAAPDVEHARAGRDHCRDGRELAPFLVRHLAHGVAEEASQHL